MFRVSLPTTASMASIGEKTNIGSVYVTYLLSMLLLVLRGAQAGAVTSSRARPVEPEQHTSRALAVPVQIGAVSAAAQATEAVAKPATARADEGEAVTPAGGGLLSSLLSCGTGGAGASIRCTGASGAGNRTWIAGICLPLDRDNLLVRVTRLRPLGP